MDWDDHENVSATRVFLKYLTYPEDEDTAIDLQQTMVVAMAHLDRLARPFQPKESNVKVSKSRHYLTIQRIIYIHWYWFSQATNKKGTEITWWGHAAWKSGGSEQRSSKYNPDLVAKSSCFLSGCLVVVTDEGKMLLMHLDTEVRVCLKIL